VIHSQVKRDRLARAEGVEHVTIATIVTVITGFERDIPDPSLVEFVHEALHGVATPPFRPVVGMAVPGDHDVLQWQLGDEFRYLPPPLLALVAPVDLLLAFQSQTRNLLPHDGNVFRLANRCGKNVGVRISDPVGQRLVNECATRRDGGTSAVLGGMAVNAHSIRRGYDVNGRARE
jgi:hypothetical protein